MTDTISNSPTNQANNKGVSKSNLYGLMGTVLSCIILFMIMWFYVMPYTTITEPVVEEGIMVSFGDNENAGGMGSSAEPLAAPEEEVLAPVAQQRPTSTKPVETAKEDLITSTDNTNAATGVFGSILYK